ncbi:MAG: spermidine/putrescine ABC transporter substrate-binding protein [Archaeoglobaceae archaeon]
MVNEGRRDFLKIAVAGIVGITIGGISGFFLGSSVSRKRIEELESEIRKLETMVQAPLENELRVWNWSYYINEALLDLFSEETGIPRERIVYDEFEDPNYVLAKLEAGGSGYDVVILPGYCVEIAIRKRLLMEIDKKLIPNAKFVDKRFLNPPYDPEGKYSITYMWGSTGFAWREEVAEGVTTLRQIFDPDYGFLKKYRKKITMLEEPMEVINFAKAYLGKDPNDWSDKTLEEVKEVLIRQKPYLAGYAGAEKYYPGLKMGTIYVAQAYNGDIARLREEYSKINYGIPEEGGTIWTDNFCIPKDAPHKNSAHAFINFLLDPTVAAVNSKYIKYANPITISWQFIEELLEDPVVYPPEDVLKRMWLEPSISDEVRRKIGDLMLEVKAA